MKNGNRKTIARNNALDPSSAWSVWYLGILEGGLNHSCGDLRSKEHEVKTEKTQKLEAAVLFFFPPHQASGSILTY